ncbi:IQ calmodulin-binding motif domain protein [Teratosphaeria destructans]|uniref:IQ calmodulin-binding motif domain protein n=1 Tax=Teratosphaeria destructans TaxID=418781 RepID=A0A9W7SIW6_9PEZI|nr:IQ calmodulin-binding motif domain protein [Teratosphaeria destructans]
MGEPETPEKQIDSVEMEDTMEAQEAAAHMDTMSTEEESTNNEVFAPPAHLAARLYARRKSSTTSSRRNSMSSVHSRASSISRRGSSVGCHSRHIAQHLRRASIIQSRKDRLADRALHAEQVRLRAALAKAAPRGNTSTIEERALAAQIAKEKYLAKVAAACAEEVARAKRIAEEVKERKLAEEARVRMEMEEKHAEAERRRQEYQRNLQDRRTRRADSTEKKLAVVEEVSDDAEEQAILDEIDVEEKKLDDETAVRRIQRAWRLAKRRSIINAFQNFESEMQKNGDFDEMTKLLADPANITKATSLLTHLGLQNANDEHAALNSKTFLSAFMAKKHPEFVFSNMRGTVEQDLLAKSTDLLTNFQNTMARLAPWNDYVPDPTQLEALSQSYSSYTSAFAAWRMEDSSVLIEGMVASFVELDAIWQTVKNDSRGEVASDYRTGIRDNQIMLLARIKRLVGIEKANVMIKKAVDEARESRRQRTKKRKAAEVRPRGLESASSGSTEQSTELADTAVQPSVALPPEETQPVFGAQSSAEITRKLFTPMPSNRILTHELAIDKDYRLADSKEKSALRADLYRSICVAMKEGFEGGDGALWTVAAAENVREKLLRMLKAGNSLHTLISDALDLENVNRQCQARVFSYQTFFEFMASVLPKLCAPFRDAEIAAVAQALRADAQEGEPQLESMINKLFKLLRTVDLLSLDYTNFMLMNAAPTLIKEASGYEARAFAADLEAGRITLERTKQWYKVSLDLLAAEADRRDPAGLRLDRPSHEKVYARGLADLATGQGLLAVDAVPETLSLDTERFETMRQQTMRIAVIGATLLTAKNLLKRDVRAQWKNEAGRLWHLLSSESFEEKDADVPTSVKAFSVLDTAHNLPPSTKQQLSGTIGRFFSQAASGRFTDPVLKVLGQRLRTHILTRLSASTSSERVRATSCALESLTSIGLGEMMTQVAGIVETLEKVRSVDLAAHEVWYAQIVRELGA